MRTTVVDTSGLRKVFGDVVAVDHLTLKVDKGEVFGFLGPNGAGKTTTINMLLGLVHPTAGEARVLGKRPGDRAAMTGWASGRSSVIRLPSIPSRDTWRQRTSSRSIRASSPPTWAPIGRRRGAPCESMPC